MLDDVLSAVPIQTSGPVEAMNLGGAHTCAVVGGSVQCWGDNQAGQAGQGTSPASSLPQPVNGLSGDINLEPSGPAAFHTCVSLLNNGQGYCWGANTYGQLGNGSMGFNEQETSPVQIGGGFKSMVVGGYHTCAINQNETVSCWGDNSVGAVGAGPNTSTVPQQVAGLVQVDEICAGELFSCARTSGSVRCWGDSSILGPNTGPTPVAGVANAQELSCGGNHACARQSDGSVRCWGQNTIGQLGNGTAAPVTGSVAVSGLQSAARIACGGNHCCVLTQSADVLCWGANGNGQLGQGDGLAELSPAPVMPF